MTPRTSKLSTFLLAALTASQAGILEAAEYNPALELGSICSKVLSGQGANSQRLQLCKSAMANDNTAFTNDNNARVLVPVAVVCAYTCALSSTGAPVTQKVCGGANIKSVPGSEGNPCTLAQASAQSAANSDQQAFEDRVAKYGNLISAAAMQSSHGPVVLSDGDINTAAGKSQGAGGGPIPDSCKRARSTGSVNDRFDCALATDNTIPKFIKDPKFQAEFQQITGYSLQSVINKSESEVSSNVTPVAMKNIYSSLKGKLSLSAIVATAEKMASSALSGIQSGSGLNFFASNSRPQSGSSDDGDSAEELNSPGELSETETRKNSLQELNAMPSNDEAGRNLASNSDPTEDIDLSLFVRASHRYRLVMDRVEKLDWDLPSNKN